LKKESKIPSQVERDNKPRKLLDRFKVKVGNQEFMIEIYNQDLSDDFLRKYSIVVNGTPYSVEVESLATEEQVSAQSVSSSSSISKSTKKQAISTTAGTSKLSTVPIAKPVSAADGARAPLATGSEELESEKILTAPMPGKIMEIKTKVGDKVEAGQPLVILEAMKMENVMPAPVSGTVIEIPIKVGQNVNQGDKMVIID
jgi:biotin carboxyl carrier protein